MVVRSAVVLMLVVLACGCVAPADQFIAAIDADDVAKVERWLEEQPDLANARQTGWGGRSALHHAMRKENPTDASRRIVALLDKHDADPAVLNDDDLDFLRDAYGIETFKKRLAFVSDQEVLDRALILAEVELCTERTGSGNRTYPGCMLRMPPDEYDQVCEQQVALLRAKGAGTTGRFPEYILDQCRRVESIRPGNRSSERYRGIENDWQWTTLGAGTARELILVRQWGWVYDSGVAIIAFDSSLHVVRFGTTYYGGRDDCLAGTAAFRMSDERLPGKFRDRWLPGLAFVVDEFDGSKPWKPAFTDLWEEQPANTVRIVPIDWFGDEIDYRALQTDLGNAKKLEFRIPADALPQ